MAALWKGLEPALWRQASYGSLKYGLYAPIKRALAGDGSGGGGGDGSGGGGGGGGKGEPPLRTKIVAGALSGAIAQGAANPTDLVKVRMMASGMGGGGGAGAGAGPCSPRFPHRHF